MHSLVTRHDLRRQRLASGITVNALARVLRVRPERIIDIEEGRVPLEEHDALERAMDSMACPAHRPRS